MLATFTRRLGLVVSVLVLAALAGCASTAPSAPIRLEFGRVELIQVQQPSENRLVNPGTVLGAVAGGVIGHQIGSGTGNTVATVAGVVGGAMVGNEVNKRQNVPEYRITVRL